VQTTAGKGKASHYFEFKGAAAPLRPPLPAAGLSLRWLPLNPESIIKSSLAQVQ